MSRILKLMTPLALALVLACGSAFAMGSSSSSSDKKAMDPNYVTAKQMVDDGKYADAIPLLEKVVAADSKNADAYNYLGYSNRKIGKTDAALTAYEAALAINPRHRGANEYLGELYLILGNLPKAEERLSVLDDACLFGCDEYTELKHAIAEYKKTNAGS